MPSAFRWFPDLTRNTSTGAQTTNLGVNPISAIQLTVRAKITTANTDTPYGDVLGLLSSISVLFDQEPVKVYTHFESAFVEAAIMDSLIARQLGRSYGTASGIIQVGVPIAFGKYMFDRDWSLPGRPAGRNQISYTVNGTNGNATFVDLTIEELQLLNVTPKSYVKSIESTFTPSGTGETDVFLSLETGWLLGVLLRTSVAPNGTTQTGDIDWVRFLLNNEVWGYYQMFWETLHADLVRKTQAALDFFDHKHIENTAAAYTQNATTDGPISGTAFDKYGYLDFDPLNDLSYAPQLNVRQASVHMNINTASNVERLIQRTLIPT